LAFLGQNRPAGKQGCREQAGSHQHGECETPEFAFVDHHSFFLLMQPILKADPGLTKVIPLIILPEL
jgi:hypothetical protein